LVQKLNIVDTNGKLQTHEVCDWYCYGVGEIAVYHWTERHIFHTCIDFECCCISSKKNCLSDSNVIVERDVHYGLSHSHKQCSVSIKFIWSWPYHALNMLTSVLLSKHSEEEGYLTGSLTDHDFPDIYIYIYI